MDVGDHKDSRYTGPAPTLSGYLEFARAKDHGDYDSKRAVETEATEQWIKHWFQPRPAIVHYSYLHDREEELLDYSLGADGKTGEGLMQHAAGEVARINDRRDYEAAKGYVVDRRNEWGRENKELDAEQKASFQSDKDAAVERRANSGNGQSRDTSEFFARTEIVSRYLEDHEVLNERFRRDVGEYVGQVLERLGRNPDKVKADLERAVRASDQERERDTPEKAWERFQDRQKGADHDQERER
jgi:hypothetical protein